MQLQKPLSKRFKDFLSHLSVILILLIGIPLESCLENFNTPPKNNLDEITSKPNRKLENPSSKFLSDSTVDIASEKKSTSEESMPLSDPYTKISSVPFQDIASSRIPDSTYASLKKDKLENNSQSIVTETRKDNSTKKTIELELDGKIFKTRQGGYAVSLYKEAGIWQAIVKQEIGVFSRNLSLPVYVGTDISLDQLAKLDSKTDITTGLIHVIEPNPIKQQAGYVYIGSGLLGGGLTSDEEKTQKEKRKKDNSSSSSSSSKDARKKKTRTNKHEIRNRSGKRKRTGSSSDSISTKKKEQATTVNKAKNKRKISRPSRSSRNSSRSLTTTTHVIPSPNKKKRKTKNILSLSTFSDRKQGGAIRKNIKEEDEEDDKEESNAEEDEEESNAEEDDEKDDEYRESNSDSEEIIYPEDSFNLKENKKFIKQVTQAYKSKVSQVGTEVNFETAMAYYQKLADAGDEESQKILIGARDKRLYSNPHQEAMRQYSAAIETAVGNDNVEDLNLRAKSITAAYEKKFRRISDSSLHTRTYISPLRLSDLIVMNLNTNLAPSQVEWGGDYTESQYASADTIFGPLFNLPPSVPYEDGIMTIDPSGKGEDETAYCVVKRSGESYFILAMGGMAGQYESQEKDKEKTIGNDSKVLQTLLQIAHQHNIRTIYIENNNDKSYAKLLKDTARALGKNNLIIKSKHQGKGKEIRILNTLGPKLRDHHIVIDQTVLQQDFDSREVKELYYKFFYQLMTVVKHKKKSQYYFDGLKPHHDDRVDAVADAIQYLEKRKEKLAKLKKEANKGKELSQLLLGKMYRYGLGVSLNYKEAQKWYAMALTKKNAEAGFHLAEMYRRGLIEPENIHTSLPEYIQKLYEFAAEYLPAKYILYKIYKEGTSDTSKKQPSEKGKEHDKDEKDIQFSLQKLKEIAIMDVIEAQIDLGQSYYQSGDYKKAIKWYISAAEQGNVEAQYTVATMYYEGLGVDRIDYEQARVWYEAAAKNNHAAAQCALGIIYQEGKGIPSDIRIAREYYVKASEKNNGLAQFRLAEIKMQGIQVQQDVPGAIELYELAGKYGYLPAYLKLGKIYAQGFKDIPKDGTTALNYYIKGTS